jgi:hypothetical protein
MRLLYVNRFLISRLFLSCLSVMPAAFFGIDVTLRGGPQGTGEPIDTQRSSITIHVGKAGVFAVAAHEHWVAAKISSGMVADAGETPNVRFTVDARELTVKPESGVSEKDQAEVQSNMQTKVLESSAYPAIVFSSTQVRRSRRSGWRVTGDLTLHGITKPITFDVTRDNDAFVGVVRIRQTDFGIQPIKIGGGVVKVKDELEISFQVYTVTR